MALEDIDTIVVVIMENRSFDHALGYLSTAGGGSWPVEGIQTDAVWLAAHTNGWAGGAYQNNRLAPSDQNIVDPSHDYVAIDRQINTPAAGAPSMGGFARSYANPTNNNPMPTDLSKVMGYYDAESVPVYDFFARHFTVCDHWFAALPAGTQPNRLMAMSGYSQVFANGAITLPPQRLVYQWLTDNDVCWCAYQYGTFFPFFTLDLAWSGKILESLVLNPSGGPFRRFAHFGDAWRSAPTMPKVIFIEPEYDDGPHKNPCDDHSPTGIAHGQLFLADVFNTLVSNPDRWAKTLLIVTYDEHGGFFDHVPPLDIPATVSDHQFATSGLRVPALLISPYAPRAVFNRNLDHTSILQFLADRFTRGHGYSDAVNSRQGFVDRIANALTAAPGDLRDDPIPQSVIDGLTTIAAAAQPSPPLGASATDPANAQAFHNVAVNLRDNRPDLLNHPEMADVRDYLASVGQLGGPTPPTPATP